MHTSVISRSLYWKGGAPTHLQIYGHDLPDAVGGHLNLDVREEDSYTRYVAVVVRSEGVSAT